MFSLFDLDRVSAFPLPAPPSAGQPQENSEPDKCRAFSKRKTAIFALKIKVATLVPGFSSQRARSADDVCKTFQP
jgi:hypothetical protein